MALGLRAALARPLTAMAAELLARRAELVEVAGGHHGDPVGRRRRPEGQRPLHEAAGAVAPAGRSPSHGDRGPTLVTLRARLPDRAEAHHVVGQPGRHRGDRVDHRPELPRRLEAAGEPVEIEPQGVLQLDDAHAREPRRRVLVAGIGGDPVDVGEREPGVGDRFQHCVDREVERIAVDASAHLALTDAADDGLAFEPVGSHHRSSVAEAAITGAKNGSHTSSYSSNETRTGIPMKTSSGAHPTMLVVSRSPTCSGNSTMATT